MSEITVDDTLHIGYTTHTLSARVNFALGGG
jgi:hypothetical protein